MARILIGICSGQRADLAERRRWCRETWLAQPVAGIDWKFFVGGGRESFVRVDGDTIILPCRDDASGCSDKTRAIARYALELGCDRIVRCCDDTYIKLDRLAACGLPGDYGGCVLPGKTYCSGGAAYWLSRRAMEIVAFNLPSGIYAEDQAVGELLAKRGIVPVDDQQFRSWFHDDGVGPRPDNDLITTHALRTWDLVESVHWAAMGQTVPDLSAA